MILFEAFPRFSVEGAGLTEDPLAVALEDLNSVLGVEGGACAFLVPFSAGVPELLLSEGVAAARSRREPLLPRGNCRRDLISSE